MLYQGIDQFNFFLSGMSRNMYIGYSLVYYIGAFSCKFVNNV